MGHIVSIAAIQLCHYNVKAATDNIKEQVWLCSNKLYLQKIGTWLNLTPSLYFASACFSRYSLVHGILYIGAMKYEIFFFFKILCIIHTEDRINFDCIECSKLFSQYKNSRIQATKYLSHSLCCRMQEEKEEENTGMKTFLTSCQDLVKWTFVKWSSGCCCGSTTDHKKKKKFEIGKFITHRSWRTQHASKGHNRRSRQSADRQTDRNWVGHMLLLGCVSRMLWGSKVGPAWSIQIKRAGFWQPHGGLI